MLSASSLLLCRMSLLLLQRLESMVEMLRDKLSEERAETDTQRMKYTQLHHECEEFVEVQYRGLQQEHDAQCETTCSSCRMLTGTWRASSQT
jgi:hypothetical protein